MAESRHSGEFSVLFVCTANVCRSPLAEHLARSASVALGLPLRAHSAGTQAVAGDSIHPLAAATLKRRGIGVAPSWTSRPLDYGTVQAADLILVAEPSHRSRVVQLAPAALARTYPLLQFSELVKAAPQGSIRSLPDLRLAANAARSRVTASRHSPVAIHDPIGGSRAAFDACAATIHAAIEAILRPLADWN